MYFAGHSSKVHIRAHGAQLHGNDRKSISAYLSFCYGGLFKYVKIADVGAMQHKKISIAVKAFCCLSFYDIRMNPPQNLNP